MATQRKRKAADLPQTFREFVAAFPKLADTHESLAKVVDDAGPLDRKTCELIKIGICLGGGLESALRSHARRAREAGASDVEVKQAVLLGLTTCGFPRTVAGWRWAEKPRKRVR